MFRTGFCPSSGVLYCTHRNRHVSYRLCWMLASGTRMFHPERSSVHHQESSNVHTEIGVCHTGYAECLLAGPECSNLVPLASSQHNLYDIYLSLCVKYKTPDDGQKTRPKHVQFYSKNKFEKLVHLVCFIIRTLQYLVFRNSRSWLVFGQVE
jgi:hypothetical protein